MLRNLWLVSLLLFSFSSMACLDEGDNVSLTGVLKKESVTDSTGQGEKSDYWFFYPDKSAGCFNAEDDATKHYNNKLQVILFDNQYNDYRAFLGKDIKLKGQIMFANSPYHYTPVLILNLSDVGLVKGNNRK